MDTTPLDIDYHLGLQLNYMELLNLCAVSRRFSQLCINPLFWYWKAMTDFKVTEEEFSQIVKEIPPLNLSRKIVEHEAYIRVAGEHNYPLPGAEKYGRINNLLVAAVRRDYYDYLIAHMGPLGPYGDIGRELGQKGNRKIINKVIHLLGTGKYTWMPYIVEGAIIGHHLQLAIDLIATGAKYLYHVLDYPAKRGDYDTINQLITMPEIKRSSLPYAGKAAAEAGNWEMIEYIRQYGHVDFRFILDGAIAGLHYDLINYALPQVNIEGDYLLKEAVKTGNEKMVDYIIEKFNIIDCNRALGQAAKYSHLNVVRQLIEIYYANDVNRAINKSTSLPISEFLLNKGAKPTNEAVISAVAGNNLSLVKYLLDLVPAVYNDYRYWVQIAINGDNLPLVKFLLARYPVEIDDLSIPEYPDIINYFETIFRS